MPIADLGGLSPRARTLLPPRESEYIKADRHDLRRLAKLLGLSGSQAANIAGVDSKTFRKWIGGERNIPYASWAMLLIYGGFISPPQPKRRYFKTYVEPETRLNFSVKLLPIQHESLIAGDDFSLEGLPYSVPAEGRDGVHWIKTHWSFHSVDRVTIKGQPMIKSPGLNIKMILVDGCRSELRHSFQDLSLIHI